MAEYIGMCTKNKGGRTSLVLDHGLTNILGYLQWLYHASSILIAEQIPPWTAARSGSILAESVAKV